MRKTMTTLATLSIALGTAGLAGADTRADREAERLREDLKISDFVKFDPDPGVARAPAMKPGWCDLTSKFKNQESGGRLERRLGVVKRRGGLGESSLLEVAELLCAHPNAPDWHKQTGYVVQVWMNQTGLGVKGAVASIRARVDVSTWKAQRKQTCSQFTSTAEDSPEQKRMTKAMRTIYGCGGSWPYWMNTQSQSDQLEYYVDKTAEMPSEVLKSFWVMSCLRMMDKLATHDASYLMPYVRCGVDAQSLSRTRLEAEIKRDKLNGFAAVIARDTMGRAKLANRMFRAAIDKLVKRDPTYAEVFYTAPAKGFKEWVALYKANKPAMDAALAYEQKIYGPSKRAMRGCSPTLRNNFAAYVRSNKPKTKKQFEAAAHDPIGMVLLGAWLACETVEGNKYASVELQRLWSKGRIARGPRFAGYYAALDAIVKIRADRTRFPLTLRALGSLDAVRLDSKVAWLRGQPPIIQDAKGVVKRVKKVKGGVRLEFKTVRWVEPVYNCRDTNRVQSIDSSGRLQYQRICVDTGRNKTHTKTEKPTFVPAYAAKGIKRGSLVILKADYAYNDPKFRRPGFPLEVYKTKRHKKLVSYYGVAL